MEGLTIGRMVHYVHAETKLTRRLFAQGTDLEVVPDELSGQHEAATVTKVVDAEKGICNLFVMEQSTQPHGRSDVPYSDAKEPGTWHWIERA